MCTVIYVEGKHYYPKKRFQIIKDDNGIDWQAKMGEKNAHHWAVVPEQLIQVEKKEAITKWHLDWQYLFEEKLGFSMEVQKFDSTRQEWRRADVLCEKNKTVVEFQHSPISSEEIRERTAFWVAQGYRVVWLFSDSWIEKGARKYATIGWEEEMRLRQEAHFLGLKSIRDLAEYQMWGHKRLENMRYSRKPSYVECDGYVFLENTKYDYLCAFDDYFFLDPNGKYKTKSFRHKVKFRRVEKLEFLNWVSV
jgi:very-short-patch-repair endonuclease